MHMGKTFFRACCQKRPVSSVFLKKYIYKYRVNITKGVYFNVHVLNLKDEQVVLVPYPNKVFIRA